VGECRVQPRCRGGTGAEIGWWGRKSKQWFFGGLGFWGCGFLDKKTASEIQNTKDQRGRGGIRRGVEDGEEVERYGLWWV
jgi:hypothetical protein